MSTFTKIPLSGAVPAAGSTGGRQLKVTGHTTGTSITVHSTPANTTTMDEIWLYAFNKHTAGLVLNLEWGFTSGATPGTDDLIKITVPAQSGLICVIPGLILMGQSTGPAAGTLKAWVNTDNDNLIQLSGYVNRIE